MKAQSNTKPQRIIIDKVGNQAHISLSKNIVEIEEGYEYDYQLVIVDWRENLMEDIDKDFEIWFGHKETPKLPSLEERIVALETLELERLLNG